MAALLLVSCVVHVEIPRFYGCGAQGPEAGISSALATARQAIQAYQAGHGRVPDVRVMRLATRGPAPGPAAPAWSRLAECPGSLHLVNAINELSSVKFVERMPAQPDGTSGWMYCTSTGDFRANLGGVGPAGTPYFEL